MQSRRPGQTFLRCLTIVVSVACSSRLLAGSIFDFENPAAKPTATRPATSVPAPIKPTLPDSTPATQPIASTPKPKDAPVASSSIDRLAGPREVPPKADLERSGKLLKEAFASQLDDHSPAGRRKLAETLLAEATKAGESPADQYMLIAGAINAAREAADLRLVILAAGELSKGFVVDPSQVKLRALLNFPLKADTPSNTVDNILGAFDLIDGLVADEMYVPAAKLCAQARAAAAGDAALVAIIEKRQGDIDQLTAARERIALALKKLEAAPADPGANYAVGAFKCFYATKWPAGLAMLAKGSDADLKKLAADDLAATPSSDAEKLRKLGDGWWTLSAKYPPAVQARIRHHALSIYARIDSKLEPLQRIKIDNRATELAASESGPANALAEIVVKQKLARVKELTDRAADSSEPRTPYPASPDPLDGDVSLPPLKGGYVVTEVDIGYNTNNHGGDNGKKWLTSRLTLQPGVNIEGGTLAIQSGALDIEGTAANPVFLRNVHVACEYTGSVKARYAVFENCVFSKDGGWYWNNGPNAKFDLKHCAIVKGDYRSFDWFNSGIKFEASTFVGCKLPDRLGRPGPDDDSLVKIQNEWNHIGNCDFFNCETAASTYELPNHSNFYHCKITDKTSYRSGKALKIELGLPGEDHENFLAELATKVTAVGEGQIRFTTPPGGRYATGSYP